jgi:hypothetical protein
MTLLKKLVKILIFIIIYVFKTKIDKALESAPLTDFLITKTLTKAPKEYTDAKT